jgi:MFS family permease
VGVADGVAARGGQRLALAALCTMLFLTFLDNTVVSVALGDVQASLHAGANDLQWVVGAYALTFAIFFFTALYLAEVAGASGQQLALVSLPMTVLMIASALLAGRRVGGRASLHAVALASRVARPTVELTL